MQQKTVYDFDSIISRDETHAEKYAARERFFGKSDVEPFWVADMDLPSPEFLSRALHARVNHPMYGYTEQYPAVFESIRWWMSEQHDVNIVSDDRILLSPSVVTSISLAIQAFTNEGDAVAVLSPVYGPFFSCTTANGRKVADCPLLVQDGRFAVDFSAFEQMVSRSDVKLMLLCNPHNPGGRSWNRDELECIADICQRNGVVIFSDEIHSDIVYSPSSHVSMLGIDAARSNVIMAHSIGKTFNCSGLQASYLVIPDAGLRGRLRIAQNRVHAGDINLLGKTAIATCFSEAGAEYKRQLVAYLHENIKQVCGLLRTSGSIRVMEPEATFLVWCDFSSHGAWDGVFRRLVHDANVALSGGSFFGPAGEGWFRINCGHPRRLLLPAVERIVRLFG
ncbi:MAG: PatB family C-S lyase [Pontiellaceae bacterium]|nr:PatB family C-S lyase [Pontiellaceae bacterium]MBN2785094.1 PatB family C-S lyase [Pontiellaceae bacterium]